MGGQDCDGSTLPQAPIGSRPIRSDGLPCPSPTDDDRQISSEDRRSVKLRVRPPPAGTHQCHRATSAGSGMMLTVHLGERPGPGSHSLPRCTRGSDEHRTMPEGWLPASPNANRRCAGECARLVIELRPTSRPADSVLEHLLREGSPGLALDQHSVSPEVPPPAQHRLEPAGEGHMANASTLRRCDLSLPRTDGPTGRS